MGHSAGCICNDVSNCPPRPINKGTEKSDSLLDLLESTQDQLGHIQLDADIHEAAKKYDQER
jgi:hypothetical protein